MGNIKISQEVRELLLEMQNEVCAICGEIDLDRNLAVDHDHSLGTLRGLLCRSCNIGLGFFKDNIKNLRKAADYIEESHQFFNDCCPKCYMSTTPYAHIDERENRKLEKSVRLKYSCINCFHTWSCGWASDVWVYYC